MTTLTLKTAAPFGWLVNIAGMLAVGTRALVQTLKNRHDAAMLTGLDDRMLADIGLTRGDLRDAYSEPVWRDPTAILVNRANERRTNRPRRPIGLTGKVFESPSIVPAQQQSALRTPVSVRYY